MTTLRELAHESETLREQAHALAEASQGLAGSARRDAADRWWVIVRKLQKVNAALLETGAAGILAALDAEREAGRRDGLAAAGHLCLELSKTVDARENLALRKGMHDAGAIILSMTDHEAQRRAQARAQEVASWALPVRSGSGTEAARDAAIDNAPETEAP